MNKEKKVSISIENLTKARLEKGMSVNKLGAALEEKGVLTARSLRRDLASGRMDLRTVEAISIILGCSPHFLRGEEDSRTFIQYSLDGIQESQTKLFKFWLGNISNRTFHAEIMFFPEPEKRKELVYNLTEEEATELQRYLIKHAGAWFTNKKKAEQENGSTITGGKCIR